jgi:hypothetical protein
MRAATFAERDHLQGVSENIMLGQMCPLGTGAFDLFLNDDMLHVGRPGWRWADAAGMLGCWDAGLCWAALAAGLCWDAGLRRAGTCAWPSSWPPCSPPCQPACQPASLPNPRPPPPCSPTRAERAGHLGV